jgi:purine-binding chemotaxis protein CheW
MKLGLPEAAATNRTCIIVVNIKMAGATKLMGLIVDALEEVFQIAAEDMEPPPDFGPGVPTGCIQNMAKTKGQVKALLNIDHIVQNDQALLPATLEQPLIR